MSEKHAVNRERRVGNGEERNSERRGRDGELRQRREETERPRGKKKRIGKVRGERQVGDNKKIENNNTTYEQ